MASEWFSSWVTRHASVFGVNDDADLATLMAWEPVFAAARATPLEMAAATDWLARNSSTFGSVPERYAGKMIGHLSAIQRALREVRSVSRGEVEKRDRQQAERLGTCSLCGSTGMVRVPQPKHCINGEWRPVKIARGGGPVYYHAAVLCSCALGRWIGQRQHDGGGKLQMTLEQFEQHYCPDWRRQMEDRAREQAEANKHSPVSQEWDTCVKNLLERFLARVEAHP